MKVLIPLFSLTLLLLACSSQSVDKQPSSAKETYADVVNVSVSGNEYTYNFSVTLSSPDKGSNQYADWWEVISENGNLIYRRILGHSHVNEQPFIRSGGGVNITTAQIVWIRAHMNNTGYGGKTYKGSIDVGFETAAMLDGFALAIENEKPQPNDCAF